MMTCQFEIICLGVPIHLQTCLIVPPSGIQLPHYMQEIQLQSITETLMLSVREAI